MKDVEEKLEIDEVMTLQMSGMPVSEIMKCNIERFEQLLESNPELNGFLDKANDILDRQEALA